MVICIGKSYPDFSVLIHERLSRLKPKSLRLLRQYTNLSEVSLFMALRYGPPRVEVRPLSVGTYGETRATLVLVNEDLVSQYVEILSLAGNQGHDRNALKKLVETVQMRLLAVVCHEIIHYGLYKTGQPDMHSSNDAAHQWERLVYGGQTPSREPIPGFYGFGKDQQGWGSYEPLQNTQSLKTSVNALPPIPSP